MTTSFINAQLPALPDHLINQARQLGRAKKIALCGADNEKIIQTTAKALSLGLIDPVYFGKADIIERLCGQYGIHVNKSTIIHCETEEDCADQSALYCGQDKADILMKGHVHSDTFMRAAIKKSNLMRETGHFVHQFYITPPDGSEGLLITDGAVILQPKFERLKSIMNCAVTTLLRLGYECPKVAFLSASEVAIEKMPGSVQAKDLCDWAQQTIKVADFAGPLALDLILSPEAAKVKGLQNNPVAGHANAIIVPEIVSGNAIFKALVYLGGGCAAGIVLGAKKPIILTSRADPIEARIASIAFAMIAGGKQE